MSIIDQIASLLFLLVPTIGQASIRSLQLTLAVGWCFISRNFRNPDDNRWPIPQSEQDINPKLK